MRNKVVLPALAFVLAIGLTGYVSLSVYVGRTLTPSEFDRFSAVILKSAIFHRNEGGASKSLILLKQAMSDAPSNATIEIVGRSYAFPLPKYVCCQVRRRGGLYFQAFVSPDEVQDYFHLQLPEAGWRHVDQLAADHSFEGHDARMNITQHFYLTQDISEFGVSIRER
jgi:hypothetical protein